MLIISVTSLNESCRKRRLMNGVCVWERERDENEMQRDRAPRYRALQLLERIHWPGIGRFGIGPWRCFACARLLLFLLFHSEKKWNFRPTGKHLDTPGAGEFTKYSWVLFLAHQRVITDRNEFRYLFLNSPFNFCNFFQLSQISSSSRDPTTDLNLSLHLNSV